MRVDSNLRLLHTTSLTITQIINTISLILRENRKLTEKSLTLKTMLIPRRNLKLTKTSSTLKKRNRVILITKTNLIVSLDF